MLIQVAILAYLILGEILSPLQLFGIALVANGILLAQLKNTRLSRAFVLGEFIVERVLVGHPVLFEHLDTGVDHARRTTEVAFRFREITHQAVHHIRDETHFSGPVLFGFGFR
jgi:hypothetical protein